MSRSLQEWIAEGEEIYNSLMDDQREIELQIELMEEQLSSKLSELNQVATLIGKPPVQRRARTVGRPISGELLDGYSAPAAANIVRALNGRIS